MRDVKAEPTPFDACYIHAAAMPHLTIDPIVAASSVVTSLQHLVSRVTKATEGAVISVSRFNTGNTQSFSGPVHASSRKLMQAATSLMCACST